MDFLKVMNERFAAKSFDSTKKISREDIKNIVEYGRLSPSSYGLEPWKFIIISNQEMLDKLVPICYNQSQVGTSSHTIIILNKRKEFETGNSYIANTFTQRMPTEKIAKFMTEMVEGSINAKSVELRDAWSKMQGYIAASNMMTGAKSLGIDSCPMEGFMEDSLLEILNIKKENYGVAMVIPFGFADKPGYPKVRFPIEQTVEYIE